MPRTEEIAALLDEFRSGARLGFGAAENNYINPFRPNTYEATLMYLIWRQGELNLHADRQILGLFPQATWDQAFDDAGLAMRKMTLDGLYDPYLLGDGQYPLTVFVGQKLLRETDRFP